ncbi:hypothetical protein ACLKA7_012154 [Drosophila subpalustris]
MRIEPSDMVGLHVLPTSDTYSGTAWFTIFKDNITSAFLNKIQPDAISLGNHEFDKNVEGLLPFLNSVDFPVLVCNFNLTNEPELASTKSLSNSTILEVNGVQIGVIGYLTPDTQNLSLQNNVEYNEEIVSIKRIARDCPEVDIVIGGHSHTFLDSSQPVADKDDTNPEAVRGPYPTTVVQPSGKKVPVVQAYAYTKYLGKLHVQFDSEGNLIEFNGTPILLNASVAQEQDLLDLLDVYRPSITAMGEKIVGHTKVYLEGGKICRARECNLGNLIADSMVHARVLENKGGNYWTDAAVALILGGGIRSAIEKNGQGSITLRDLQDTLPFENSLYLTRIKGQTLRNALERSAAAWNTDSNGAFMQFSGIRAEYDFSKNKGHRVVSALVRCAECNAPSYSHLNESAFYNVIIPSFLFNGGDGYRLVEEHDPFSEVLQADDVGALQQYLQGSNIVYPQIEGRIVIRTSISNTLCL